MTNTNYTKRSAGRTLARLAALLLIFVASFTAMNVSAQTTVTIGSGTTTSSFYPIYTCYGYSYSQQIYTAAEMTAGGAISGGQISQVKFFYASGGTSFSLWNNWTVYLGNTALNNFTGATGWASVGSLTQVFSGNIPTPVAGTWLTLNLSTPFTWSGGNLLVAVDENTPSYSCTAAWRSFTTTAAPGPRSILYYSDATNPNPATPPAANNSSTSVRAQIQMTMTGGAACTGTPNAGTASASVANACAGEAVNLSATGLTSASGMSYQWQSSTDGGAIWNSISGATTSSASVTQSVATSYRLRSTCTNSGQTATSNVVSVGQNLFTSCYPTSSATSTADEEIFNVTLGGINQSSVCGTLAPGAGSVASMYSNYRGVAGGQITQGASESVSLSLGYCGTTAYSNMAAVYIDYNQNGSFADAGEQVYTKAYGALTLPSQVVTGSFTVPMTATLGQTGMRVVYVESSVISSSGTYSWGETEDYLVTVAAPTPMSLNTITTDQQTGIIGGGAIGAVIRVNVNTSGVINPLTVDGFQVSTTGTTDETEILSARMTYTGSSATYSAATAFGSIVYNPSGIYQINGSRVLANGNNYFFLAYEIAPWVTACNHMVDATVDNVSINSQPNTVANNNPAGALSITPPITSTNLAPANGFVSSCRNVLLSWSAVSPNTSYDVYVDGSLFAIGVTTGSQNVALAGTHTWDVVPTGATPTGCSTRTYTAASALCYCVPSVAYGCGDNDIIARVTVNTLDNNSGTGCPSDPVPGNQGSGVNGNGYSDYTSNPALTTSLMQGYTYPVTVYVGQWSEAFAVWVDGNDDGVFSAAERVGYTTTNPAGSGTAGVLGGSATFPIVLDCNSPVGTHRMRVRCVYGTTGSAITPCASATYGETEDYNITYTLGPVTEPIAGVVTGPTEAICNSILTYTVDGSFGALQWQYSLDAITWTDITGATSATQGLVPSGPATYALRVRARGIGCTPDAYSEMIVINVASPTLSIDQAAVSICRGTSATLTATSDYPNAVYTWSNGQTGASITVSPLVETTYTVTVGGGLCTASASATVSVSGPTATMANVPSTTGCPGTSHTLTGTLIEGLPASGGYTVTNVPFSMQTGAGTAGPSGDDVVSGAIALPFPFTYYGNTYNSIVISTNGFISFDAAPGSGCCSGQTLPSATTPNNVIALGWDDLNAGAGQITYFSTGSSFVIDFNGVPHFGGAGTPVTGQIVLNADGTIQINSVAVISDGSAHTQGVENSGGTLATATPGANGSATLSLINQSYLFAPPSNIPFTFDGPVTYSWNTGASTNSITVAPDVTTTYTLTVADNSCSSVLPVTVNVHTPPTVSVSNNGPICNGATVSLTATPTSAAAPVVAGGMAGATVAYNTVAQSGTIGAGPAGDDVVSGAIALPFAFSFYGTTYNNVYISTNGFISFTNAGSGCCSGQAIPNFFGPVVALGWTDLNTNNGGNITYWNNATQFVVSFNNVAVFSGVGSINGQIVLNSDGSIDINSASVATSGVTTQGINAGNGSQGVAVISAVFAPVQSNVSTHFANVGGQLVYFAWNGGSAATAGVNTATPSANTTYSVTVTDANGCTASGSTDVTVVYPSITCPADMTVGSDAGVCGANVAIGTATAGAQPCDVAVSNDHPSADYPVGTTVVTWTATDDYGNIATCTQTIVVNDVEAPVISCPGAITVANDGGDCGAIVSIGAATATDNCAIDAITSDAPADGHYAVGTTTVTWTATDIHGNSSTCTQDITVTDDEAPSIACPAAMTQTADAGDCGAVVVIGSPVVGDNCGVASVSNDAPAGNHFAVGTTTVIWTVTDIHGNSSSCTQDITVTDDEAPAITCPADVIVGSDAGICGASVNIGSASATDNCAVATITNDHPSSDYPVGVTEVVWTATDIHGNSSTCTQSVKVNDTEAPVISGVTADETIECPAAPVFSTPSSSDNCGSTMTSADVTTAACGNTYATTRTWTAVDAAGNTTTASQTITVRDITAPSIATNAPVYLCYEDANPTLAAPASSDACNSVAVTRTGTNNYPVGLTTVTWTSTDACGNASSSTQNVRRNAQINATFQVSALPGYCQGNVIITILTATGGTGNLSYLWSNGATTNTVTVPNNATYTCTVTDQFSSTGSASNCSRTFSVTANLSTTGILSSYTILGTYDVHIHGYQTIQNGGVGATAAVAAPGSGSGCAGGRVKLHRNSTATGSTTFLKAKCVEVDATSASLNTYSGAAATPPMPVFDAGIVVPSTAANVTVAANTVVTLSGNVYGNIMVKAGGKLTFLHATIDCKKLQVMQGATLRGDKACTRIRVEGQFHVMKNAIINPAADNKDFAIYVDNTNTSGSGSGAGSGGSGTSGNTSVLIQQSAQVKAFIYAPNGGMEVHGPGGNGNAGTGSGSGVHSVAPATSMTGLFIARNVNAHGRATWNWNTTCATCNYTLRDGETADNAAETLKNEDLNAGMVVENFPDPFTDKTNIRFVMANDTRAQVDVFDLNGKFIKSIFNGDVKANQEYRFELDGTDLSNGMYIYKVVTPSNVHTGKMLLIKQ